MFSAPDMLYRQAYSEWRLAEVADFDSCDTRDVRRSDAAGTDDFPALTNPCHPEDVRLGTSQFNLLPEEIVEQFGMLMVILVFPAQPDDFNHPIFIRLLIHIHDRLNCLLVSQAIGPYFVAEDETQFMKPKQIVSGFADDFFILSDGFIRPVEVVRNTVGKDSRQTFRDFPDKHLFTFFVTLMEFRGFF